VNSIGPFNNIVIMHGFAVEARTTSWLVPVVGQDRGGEQYPNKS
jgi:hypothetical protein